jgi:Zn-dependent protease with chaperone function
MKNFYARSTPWGTIQVGDLFAKLSREEQSAVIAHEYGHLRYGHVARRLWWLASLQWKGFFERCEKQELEADQFAVRCGARHGLESFLLRHASRVKSPGYPTAAQRLEAIRE